MAFLCGSFYRGEAYYLSSHLDDFSEIEGVWYEKEETEIITINQIINPTFYFQCYKDENETYKTTHQQYHKMFSNSLFSSMCEKMLVEDEIQRAIKLIVVGSGISDPIQKGAMYSVAIETLSGFLSVKNEDNLKPIKDEETFLKIKTEILDVISNNSNRIGPVGKEILEKKIDNLNSPTNRDKLIKPFEIYGIKLTDENIKTIGKRNSYLHGRVPLKSKEQFELNKLALELHYLVGCLILKYFGYEGHSINLPVWSIYNDQEKMRELFRNKTQEQIELMQQVKDSLEQKDESRFNMLKTKFREFNEKNEISNLIKII